ncbi:uncharacterized protein LOC105181949 isoform X2 [Harpegnathos saltator]|uniref:uncharacterized protein LOC105181949 isoform X2 n=1 Tax=Harpegnathos saltator TaxID=610380 RepID=UPI00058E3D0D|nr:uncharacterized protein LOC105181949 isoform X2 [Harpegnathos saltator]
MTDYIYDQEDSITHLNTQLNKSMVLMEDAVYTLPASSRRSKSIKISTTTQPPSVTNSPVAKLRKSILKKPDGSFSEKLKDNEVMQTSCNIENINDVVSQKLALSIPASARPRNLEEFIQEGILHVESISSESFNLDDVTDNEEIWIMDIPKSIDPKELHGQKINLSDKSKLKIKEKRYCAVVHDITYNITCVFRTGREEPQYKTASWLINSKKKIIRSIKNGAYTFTKLYHASVS